MLPSDFEKNAYLFRSNASFIVSLYEKYLQDASAVSEEWQVFFKELGGDQLKDLQVETTGPSWGRNTHIKPVDLNRSPKESDGNNSIKDIQNSIRALMMIRVYRVRGHLAAKLDPLQLENPEKIHPELDPKTYGFTDADMETEIFIDGVLGLQYATLHNILNILKKKYCGHVAVEFMHSQDPDQKSWIQTLMEDDDLEKGMPTENKKEIMADLFKAEQFELFLNAKNPGAKKFGIEGCESVVSGLLEALRASADVGVEQTVLGMAHRGRINVLANVLGKSLSRIFYEFTGESYYDKSVKGSGDVKYHLGYSSVQDIAGKKMEISLTANPSHLEAVDPVVLGRVRAKQQEMNDISLDKVMGVLLHGDAAFPGQGLVAECFGLSDLEGYRTGGTLHIVINNQIGFTTSPNHARSTDYSSDLAKVIHAPIFHVNGDDPEAVSFCMRAAAKFRQKFKKDVVVDVWGYRRYGHNEADDPSFTQPKMYQAISKKESVTSLYQKKLISNGVLSKSESEKWQADYKKQLETAFTKAKNKLVTEPDWFEGRWKKYAKGDRTYTSEISDKELQSVGLELLTNYPEDFNIHKRLPKIFAPKKKAIEEGKGIDWALAESLAFATLLSKKHPVRLSGQDSGRGTFSQRHSVFVDQETEEKFIPLNHLKNAKSKFEVIDSPLSEASVLGFEYGYTTVDPEALVMWEAQFGDFSNGAQVIIDQFISSSESKWYRLSGLVMLLPHGYEGMGPEHSSARPERYLQLCAENNMRVANCTTPANYFHILCRQVFAAQRKPLIVFTPKSLLRHKMAVSSIDDMKKGTTFQPVIEETDTTLKSPKIKRVVLCSGKIFYDLLQYRQQENIKDVAIVRIEELYPFPEKELKKALKAYEKSQVFWCQEEPQNMGAWHFVDRRIESVLTDLKFKHNRPQYIGRPEAASPATGFSKVHVVEQQEIVKKALMLKKGK